MIILTTSYNCENFIERSLLSIMGQKFKDFTCYITDDLSTDNTREIVKKKKELNTISKKRMALEEELYEMENSATYTVETNELPPLVDAIYPELQNSKVLKFEKELNEKLNN